MFNTVQNDRPNWGARLTLTVITIVVLWGVFTVMRMVRMPLRTYTGPLPPLTYDETQSSARMASDVRYLTLTIGERNLRKLPQMQASVRYFTDRFRQLGMDVKERPYVLEGVSVSNVEAVVPGSDKNAGEVIIGAHYDSVFGTVGANDNGSGVASVLELAQALHQKKFRRTIRFVLFANEEPPFFQTAEMGSRVYAHELHSEGARVRLMISLETIGFYSDRRGSQKYPAPLGLFYPKEGNFIAFVGNSESADSVRGFVRTFRQSVQFPSEGAAAPESLPGVGWSDHWSFWREGYPAIMVTDTAPFRYPHYHTTQDTEDKIDYERMARLVNGVRQVIETIANEP